MDKYNNTIGFKPLKSILLDNNICTLDELHRLLDAIGVKTRIDFLVNVLESFSYCAEIASAICQRPEWLPIAGEIYDLKKTADSILAIKKTHLKNFGQLKIPITRDRNTTILNRGGISDLYAAIGLEPRLCRDQFLQLRAQIFIANMLLGKDQDKQGLEISANLLDKALKEMRQFAREKKSYLDLLEDFPTSPLSPEIYIERLKIIPRSETTTIQNALLNIVNFLSGSLRNIPSANLASKSKADTKRAKPFEANILNPKKETPDISIQPPKISEDSNRSKSDPESAGSGKLYFHFKTHHSQVSGAELARIAQQISNARAMENQSFSTAWNCLNQHDIQTLFAYLFANDDNDLNIKAYIGLTLFAGMNYEKIEDLEITKAEKLFPVTDYYCLDTDKLCLMSPGPKYKNAYDMQSTRQCHAHQNYIDLELPEPFKTLIYKYLASTSNNGSFIDQLSATNEAVKSTLRRLNYTNGSKLNLLKIGKYLPETISRLPGCDMATASLIFGQNYYLSRTQIHYLCVDEHTLQRHYDRGCQQIFRDAGMPINIQESYPSNCRYLGTPVRPKIATINGLVENLLNELNNCAKPFNSPEKFCYYHNLYTLYTWIVLSYASGYRAVNTPALPENQIDVESGFSVIRDKDLPDYYLSRLIWLLDICIIQLKHYRNHVINISNQEPYRSISTRGELFFYDLPRNEIVPLSVKEITRRLRQKGFQLPPNVQRHLLKSELQEDGCSVEAIEAFLGHLNQGLEPWSKNSGMDPLLYKQKLKKHLPQLIKRVGITPLPGLQKNINKIDLTWLNFKPLEDSRESTGKTISNKAFPAEDPPSEIWKTHLPASRRHLPLKKAYSGEYEYVLNRIKKHFPELYKGQVGTSTSDEKIDKILGLLRQHSKGQHNVLKRTNYFIDVIAEGKTKLGWRLTVPAKPIVLPKAENRARPIMMENIHKFRSLEKEFASDLECFHKDLNHRYGQILLSAIMYGGINHCGWADAFVRAFKHGNIYKHGNMVWLDLWDKEIPQHDLEKWNLQRSAEEYRRWIADPVTKLLLAREFKNNYQCKFSEKLSLKNIFKEYIKPLAERAGLKLKSPKELMSMATARANICVPPFIAAYNENKSISSSLPDPAFMRLLTGKHYPSPIQLQKRKSKSQFNAGSSSRSVEHQQELIKNLRTLIRDNFNSSNNKIRGLLANFKDQHIHEMNSACTLLVEWAIQLLHERVSIYEIRLKNPKKPSTVFNYLGSIYEEVLSVADNLDITELDQEEFEGFLHSLTYRITGIKDYDNLDISKSAINSIERVNQFLGFLHVFYDVPKFKIELDSKNVSIKQPNVVRANLVTFQEFVRLKQRFHWTQLQRLERPRIDSIAAIWAILAFRTGMRIGEIEGLLICDFQGTDKSEILVRRNEFRHLKSDSSKRRIPLHWFVPADELVLLKKWVDMRKNEHGSTPYSPLFTLKALQYEPVTRNEILPKLSPALKEITGDQTVVFHTLRHSFASWMLLRLTNPTSDGIKELPEFLNAEEFSHIKCERLRKEILGKDSCGKQLLFSIAQHLGHSDTETLRASYVHIMDYLSHAYLSRKNSLPNLPAASIAAITETSYSNAYNISKDKKLGIFEANLQGIPTHPLEAKSINSSKTPKGKKTSHWPTMTELISKAKESNSDILLPKNEQSFALMEYWLGCLKHMNKRSIRTRAKAIIRVQKKHHKAFIFADFYEAQKCLELLDNIGIEVNILHSKYRTDSDGKAQTDRDKWSNKINRRIYMHKTGCKAYAPHGVVRVIPITFSDNINTYKVDSSTLRDLQNFAFVLQFI